MAPAFATDALVYHLAVPKAFLQAGGLINLPDNIQDEALAQLEPDNEVFGHSALNLIDLRIIENDIVEIPYGLEISNSESKSTSFPANLQDQTHIPGEFTTFVADVGPENILHNEIFFEIVSEINLGILTNLFPRVILSEFAKPANQDSNRWQFLLKFRARSCGRRL